jgi:cell division protein FtsZ
MLAFDSPKDQSSIIKVLGVGGGGGNAVNHMFEEGIEGVDFILCNTDAQALEKSPIPTKIQLGTNLTEGRGAGSKPEVGRNAAIEDIDKIKEVLSVNTKMLFITAGMGGGTGTGAAPVIAEAAKELDILSVGIVTIPFQFEGRKRKQLAMDGINEMKKYVDTILIISNDKLRELHGNLKLSEAFGKADNILTTAAKGIAEIITVTGYINVDFEDVKTVMKNSGTAIMGAGVANGENRARVATEMALNSPLLNDNDVKGSTDMLLYIATGTDNEIEMDEVSEITDFIKEQTGEQCEVIWGSGQDANLGDQISITLIATGFDKIRKKANQENPEKKITPLNTDVKMGKPKKIEYPPHDDTLLEPKIIKRNPESDEQDIYTVGTGRQKRFNLQDKETESSEIKEPTLVTKSSSEVNKDFNSKTDSEEKKEKTEKALEKDKTHLDRAKKLRELSYISKNSRNIEEMENIPAYKRKDVHISHTITSQESEATRYSLGDKDGETELKTNNSFLHDNVD